MRDGDSRMTIGARVTVGGTRFRVWAPASAQVDVVVYGPAAERVHALEPEGGGYFAGLVSGVGAGARYRYRLDGGESYPDPASRAQPEGVHGPSEVVDPEAYAWEDAEWPGVPLERYVLYEMHVGTFTREGTFDAAAAKLPFLVDLGVTAVEVMPIASFPGAHNWGYDGVSLFAPAAPYGGPEGFRRFVDRAHQVGLAVVLDVVYNHLGPEGNYLPAITGGRYFTHRHQTPWGDGINFDGPDSGPVRDFVLQNALHWLREHHVDALRLDATHAIVDDSDPHVLAELARLAHAVDGPPRYVIAEDERNERTLLLPREEGGFGIDAVWADDLHHQLRRLTAGDQEGYFARYGGTTVEIAATLRQGWWRTGRGGEEEEPALRGTSPEGILPRRFVHCIQNHDQVGNRAFGERLNHEVEPGVYRALSALLLLSPYTPLLWMGQEWAASSPFLYFTDHPDELGKAVTEGRREEFGRFSAFADPRLRHRIPDPQAPESFERSRLDWREAADPAHAGVLALYRELLRLRRDHPAAASDHRDAFAVEALGQGALALRRHAPDGTDLLALVNLRGEIRLELADLPLTRPPAGRRWSPLLATEELRFAGDGGWGTMEADGIVHLVQPGALLLQAE